MRQIQIGAAALAVLFIATSQAVAFEGFLNTPSNNIVCQLSARTAYCIVYNLQRDVTVYSNGAVRITGRSGDPGDGPRLTLRYGRSVSSRGVTCFSETTGLRCVSRTNGRGAVMSRAGVRRI